MSKPFERWQIEDNYNNKNVALENFLHTKPTGKIWNVAISPKHWPSHTRIFGKYSLFKRNPKKIKSINAGFQLFNNRSIDSRGKKNFEIFFINRYLLSLLIYWTSSLTDWNWYHFISLLIHISIKNNINKPVTHWNQK